MGEYRERVVYILGAGFSAPLGLPVMSNFLVKAKDLYFRDPDKFTSLEPVLAAIHRMHAAKTYYSTDLLNIEEVLSISDMLDAVGADDMSYDAPDGSLEKVLVDAAQKALDAGLEDVYEVRIPSKEEVQDFIITVIREYSERIEVPQEKNIPEYRGLKPGNLNRSEPLSKIAEHLCTLGMNDNACWLRYLLFACSMLDVRFGQTPGSGVESGVTEYGVITLNYDLVVERAIRHVEDRLGGLERSGVKFYQSDLRLGSSVAVKHLHGDINGELVAPTWAKLASEDIRQSWRDAYQMLRDANYIRVVGYSLPPSDSHVRYLLKAAALESRNLKAFDFIVFDPEGQVERRFNEFVLLNFRRFKNARFEEYIPESAASLLTSYPADGEVVEDKVKYWARFNKLERHHEKFMNS